MGGRRVRHALLAAAAIVLGALPPAEAGGRPAGEFLALTYNVAGLPEGISGSEPATNSPLISPLLNAYELVLLQEDWGDPVEGVEIFFHDEIVAESDHPYRSEPAPHPLGTDLRRFPTGPPLIADGLNRLSRFPFGTIDRQMWNVCHGEFTISVVEAIADALGLDGAIEDAGLGALIDGGAADCGAQKGFSVARTTVAEGVQIDVYNLHADAGSGPGDIEARAAGFVQLAEFIRKHSAGRAVILGGDTNLHTGRDDRAQDLRVWEDFQAATGLSDVCRVLDCGTDAAEIDKFAFRSGGGVVLEPKTHRFERERFKRDDGEPLSDHDPLAVTFAWRRGKGPPAVVPPAA